MPRTAAALVIGNEILTGKIADTNTTVLASGLFELGIELRRVLVVPDEIEVIAEELNALRASHDIVFTSGGVGPTHDDVTIDAVAKAFGRQVVRSAAVEQVISRYYGQEAREAHFRMANMPEGAEMLRSAEAPWPTIVIENVYVLPGVPEIFALKFDDLRKRLDEGVGFYSEAVYTRCGEGEIAALLERIATEHPSVMIGSYVKWKDADYKTKVTFDGPQEVFVRKAADRLVEELSAEDVVRREQG